MTTTTVGDASKEEDVTPRGETTTKEEDVTRDQLFQGSTIQFLFINQIEEAKRPAHACDVGLAILVIVAQMCLYLYLLLDAHSNIEEDSVVVQISHGDCIEEDFSRLTCEAS